MMTQNLRRLAATTLTPVLQRKGSLSGHFDNAIDSVPAKDRGLFQELCFGTLRHYFELEAIAKQLMSKPMRNKDMDVFAVICLGLYQIKYMRIPDHAAISESVNAVKKLKKIWAVKLVNALLRQYLREQSKLDQHAAPYQHNFPEWLASAVYKAWPNDAENIFTASNQAAPLTLRINEKLYDRTTFIAKSQLKGRASEYCKQALTLDERHEVKELFGFNEGAFSIQDEAAQISADLLQLQANQRVLDACCAPGGKSCHILEREPALKELVAIDLEASRMQRVEQNLTRLNLSATLKTCDAGDLDSWWDGEPFDRILLDAPCSATGVIRRHPDIKLLRREEDLANLSALQKHLLTQLWTTLKPGGILVYATCSILPQENTQIIEAFVQNTADASLVEMNVDWGIPQPAGRQLFPRLGGHDGFYYASIKKNDT